MIHYILIVLKNEVCIGLRHSLQQTSIMKKIIFLIYIYEHNQIGEYLEKSKKKV